MVELNVVFGAGTPLGVSLVRNLALAERKVRGVVNDPASLRGVWPDSVEITEGSPLDGEVVEEACEAAATLYLCLTFTHRNWKTFAHQMLNNVLCYAIETGVKFFLAYPIFDARPFVNNFDEQTLDAQRQGFTDVLVARLPQVYGPGLRNTLFDDVHDSIFSEKKPHWVGSLDVARDLLHVEDAGRACAALGMTPKAYGRKWDISQGTPITGRQFIELAFAFAGKANESGTGKAPELGVWKNGLLRVASILDYDSKSMAELPYDYSKQMILDGVDFITHFPRFEFTPIDVGLREVFEWYREFMKPHNLLQKVLPLNSLPA